MNIKIWVVLVVVAMMGLIVCGGGGGGKSALVGRWDLIDGPTRDNPEAMELLRDGTGIVDETGVTYKTESGRFYITGSGLSKASSYGYKVSGPWLALTTDAGVVLKYLKKGHTLNENDILKFLRGGVDVQIGSFTDSRNGQIYRTVKIGDKTWMGENLNFKTGNSWCYRDYEPNCTMFGRLYNWETANAACPNDWHLPSMEEWNSLYAMAGADAAVGKRLKSRSGWNGTDIFEFSALPSGYRSYVVFNGIHEVGYGGYDSYYWSATVGGRSGQAYGWNVSAGDDAGGTDHDKRSGYSVRCVKN